MIGKNNINKGFTLIELLIVVAIIGILAAVGAAVIPGLLEKAKINATIASHNSIVKYLKTQQVFCTTNPDKHIKLSRANGTEYNEKCSYLFHKVSLIANLFPEHFEGKQFKNPYGNPPYATSKSCMDYSKVGCTFFGGLNATQLRIQTCIKEPCVQNTPNMLKQIFTVDPNLYP